jgi:ABC-type transport system substrate-binding protein
MRNSPGVNRRNLVKSASGLPAALAMGAPVAPVRAHRQDAANRWQASDGLRLAGSVSGIASLDPALSRDLSTNFILRQIFRGLVNLDMHLEPALELAGSVDVSADERTFTFGIREDSRFHDGRAVTPFDVQFSFARALDPVTAGGSRDALAAITYLRDITGAGDVLGGSSQQLSGVAITGDRTVSITLERPSPAFLLKLASVPASIVDADQAVADSDWISRPNGSGPFAVSTWKPGEMISLAAAETWWAGKAPVPAVHIRLGSPASQPLNLFQAGEIDLLSNVPSEYVDLVMDPTSGIDHGTLVESSLLATSYIAFGNTIEPLDDIHIRRALQYAFPADLIATSMFNGAVEAATGILPPGMLGREWVADRPAVDTEAAREEIRKSRYGSPEHVPPIPIHAADILPVESLRDVARAELGLTIEAIVVPWSGFMAGLAERRFPAYSLYWGADYPDPESMIDMLFGATSADNYTGYANPELEDLLDEGRTLKGEERAEVFALANQLLVDDVAVIPLYHPVGYTLIRDGIEGVEITPMGILRLETVR